MNIGIGLIGLGIGAGLAMGLTGYAVAIAQSRVGAAAIEGVSRNPEAEKKINGKLIMILAIAESAAIYGLIIAGGLLLVAFQLAGKVA